jgi:tetratricopeptide (TPR) repeat protein
VLVAATATSVALALWANRERRRAENREQLAIAAVKRFGDVIADEPELKNTPSLEGLRKRLLKEPLAFFRTLRDRLQADRDTRPESLARLAQAGYNLGYLTSEIGDRQDALIAYRESLAIRQRLADANPTVTEFRRDLAYSHNNIGNLLSATGKPAEALKALESARAILQTLAREHPEAPDFASELGGTLNNMAVIDLDAKRFEEARGRLREAVAWQRKALAANPANSQYRQSMALHLINLIRVARGLGDAEGAADAARELAKLRESDPAIVALDARLAAIIQGDQKLRDEADRLALAQRAYEKVLYATAARLWGEALAANPGLGDNRRSQHRYNAACAAALAASGKAKGEPPLDDPARARLRARALDWLRAELVAWEKVLDSGPAELKAMVVPTLTHWKSDADLAGIRDAKERDTLPDDERAAVARLWDDVDRLLARAAGRG